MPNFAETAAEIAREAGSIVSEFARRGIGFELKGEHDLVTEADRASETLIVERLKAAFPSHAIVAEEGGGQAGDSEYRWYVDPLDGTTNFAHGFPVYNISMGLEHRGQLVAGVIYDPTRDELFSAEFGGGAFLNGRKIHVSSASRLDDALLATGFPSRKRHQNINVHFFYQLSIMTHGLRRAGAAAIDLAYVACGRLDGFWEFTLNPWDMAAGVLLVQEAGGTCSGMHGEPLDLRGPNILADNSLLHRPILGVFADVFAGNYRHAIPEVNSRA